MHYGNPHNKVTKSDNPHMEKMGYSNPEKNKMHYGNPQNKVTTYGNPQMEKWVTLILITIRCILEILMTKG